MPTNKRPPATFGDHSKGGNYWRYMKLSKADWADAYADLYRQVHGDIVSADEVITDAENRTTILKRYRAQWEREEGAEYEDISGWREVLEGPDYPGREALRGPLSGYGSCVECGKTGELYGSGRRCQQCLVALQDQRESERRQRANAASIADGGWREVLEGPATCKTCGMYLPDQDAIVSHLNNTTHPAASIVPAGAFFGNDARAWAEDEADMQRIKDEWEAFDRDPPGS